MFRIRRVFDDALPANRKALDEVVALLRSQFHTIATAKIDRIPDLLRDPVKHRFRSVVYVAEGSAGKVRGVAMLNHEPDIGFSYLDYLAADKALSGRGVGGALYQRVRQETALLNVGGLFFECLPDDPALCRDPDILKQNRARLRFYERFGARPIINTAYETPVNVGSDNPPYLVFDDLGQGTVLSRDYVQRVIAYVLRHKYRDVCSPAYVRLVVNSVKEDPVQLRPPRYSLAQETVGGRRCAYALVRPPGHHAEREFFGGFCYFNNAAIAAEYLSHQGKVAMLDIDYHHGNGQQQIFYQRDDVLTVSLHGHPSFAYPYFSGFASERGAGQGVGFNINYPLPETIEVEYYIRMLDRALAHIRHFAPAFVVVCLGLDTAKGDPTGTWPLRAADFGAIGERIGALHRPLLVLQEGGYDNRTIGANARGFFTGLAAGISHVGPASGKTQSFQKT